jgi:GNAT superfamily N-acetyltransferase
MLVCPKYLKIHFTLVTSCNSARYATTFTEIFGNEEQDTTDKAKVLNSARWLPSNVESEEIGISGLYALKTASKSYWLDFFGLRNKFRGAGLSQPLLEHAIEQARSQLAETFNIWTTEKELNNPKLRKLYEHNGLKEQNIDGVLHRTGKVHVFSICFVDPTVTDTVDKIPTAEWLH